MLSGGWLIASAAGDHLRSSLLTALTVIAVLRIKSNPLWWIAVGAVLGLAGIV